MTPSAALTAYLTLVGDLKEKYKCFMEDEEADQKDMAEHFVDVMTAIKDVIKKLKGDDSASDNKILEAIQTLHTWIGNLQNMNMELSGMDLELAKERLEVFHYGSDLSIFYISSNLRAGPRSAIVRAPDS